MYAAKAGGGEDAAYAVKASAVSAARGKMAGLVDVEVGVVQVEVLMPVLVAMRLLQQGSLQVRRFCRWRRAFPASWTPSCFGVDRLSD